MKKIIYFSIGLVSLVLLFGVWFVEAQAPANREGFSREAADVSSQPFEEVFRARVNEVVEKNITESTRLSRITQKLRATALSGSGKGATVLIDYDDILSDLGQQELKVGDVVVAGKLVAGEESQYVVVDRYRLPALGAIALVFLVLAFAFARLRGLTSLVGLAASLSILLWFIVPNILAGTNPSLVILVGAGIIAIVSIYLAHGLSGRTSLAILSTLITLGLAQGLAHFFVSFSRLAGNGSEDAFFLQAGYFGAINLQGLFLGGIVIGTLGVLDDITTSQTAAVEEIYKSDTSVSFRGLYRKGSSVGKEHITSLINTLVLTYAGASLPLFLLFSQSGNSSVWVILNSGTIAEEIVRTLVGSIALILAVPISTFLASYYFKKEKLSSAQDKDDYWDKAVARVWGRK